MHCNLLKWYLLNRTNIEWQFALSQKSFGNNMFLPKRLGGKVKIYQLLWKVLFLWGLIWNFPVKWTDSPYGSKHNVQDKPSYSNDFFTIIISCASSNIIPKYDRTNAVVGKMRIMIAIVMNITKLKYN